MTDEEQNNCKSNLLSPMLHAMHDATLHAYWEKCPREVCVALIESMIEVDLLSIIAAPTIKICGEEYTIQTLMFAWNEAHDGEEPISIMW